jgi:molecular chaperone GrpE
MNTKSKKPAKKPGGTETQELKDQIDAITNQLKRSQADFVNFKRRIEDERDDFAKYASVQVLEHILPLYDQLENALKHMPKELQNNSWAEGIVQLTSVMWKTLESMGISRIKTVGEAYQPELHEAVLVGPGKKIDVILEEFEAGYMFKDKVIRPAKVKVCNEISNT